MYPLTSVYNSTPTSGGADTSLFLIVIIAIIVVRRVYRGINGRRFSTRRIFTIPIVYTLLLLASFFSLPVSYLDEASLLLLILPGIIIGMRFGNAVVFFERDSQTFYKRSQFILVFWLFSLLARETLALLYPSVTMVILLVDGLLSLTTGLIIGESIRLYYAYNDYMKQKESKTEPVGF
jgi:membrane protein CcdC involved in cytochrome C biogenesis